MKDNIVIVGCGQHARVVLYNAIEQSKYNVVGFIGDTEYDVGKIIDGIPVIGLDGEVFNLIDKYQLKGYILGVGNMKIRRKLIEFYSSTNLEAVTIIHPQAVIAPQAVIGKGTLIECGCLITPNPKIGEHCVINTMTGVNHDNILGDNVYLASGVTLSGTVNIGNDTLIDDGVIITLGRSVGKNCIIGAGSIVTKDIENGKIAYGVPARIIKSNA
jgi:sugar O-acyltransferase (sialic acid O-acetyltransferase NeuD family)